MIQGQIPKELENLTQVEEMLISRALPIVRVYIEPGGQRGYSGHCINLRKSIKELASSLPRSPKSISVIVVKVKGKNNTFKDVNVRREKVHSALLWSLQNNPHYSEVAVDSDQLSSLPENDIPFDISTVEADTDVLPDQLANIDQGPASSEK